VLILIYGGCYTYALTPLGNWAKLAFHLNRNHYDGVGHGLLFEDRAGVLRRPV